METAAEDVWIFPEKFFFPIPADPLEGRIDVDDPAGDIRNLDGTHREVDGVGKSNELELSSALFGEIFDDEEKDLLSVPSLG